ncbi:regulatory protein, luxR family [Prauserella aidingensis]|uniref:LuxR C-terminal-related transcriptional regulator n=1 Tax=Prauserella aidingensis TaxID=387890 RepID=UPI0020A32C02|nr:LuxR C-terminal-related transcriptional regulator [Prauserella aidingensis]MCP2251331.1 regulatory protein, luxR family [Prauserella aidingensis]
MFQHCPPGLRPSFGRGFSVGSNGFHAFLREQLAGPDRRIAVLNDELAKIGARGPAAVPLLIEAGQHYGLKHDHRTRLRYAVQAYECAVESRDRNAIMDAHVAVAVASCWTGDRLAANAHVEQVVRDVDVMDESDIGDRLPVLTELAWVELQLQRLAAAEAHAGRALRAAELAGKDVHATSCRLLLAKIACELGSLAEARRHSDHVGSNAEENGDVFHAGLAELARGMIAMESGDYEAARSHAERAQEAACGYEHAAGVLAGLSMIRTGEVREGRDAVVEAGGGRLLPLVPVSTRAKVYGGLACAEASLSNGEEAVRWADLAMSSTWAGGIERTRGHALLARAEALLRSDPHAARVAACAAWEIFDGLEADLGRAAASVLEGITRDAARDAIEREEALTRGERMYRRAGATAAADRIALARVRSAESVDVPTDRPNPPTDCLSPRETEVARLIAEGKTNRQIATSLNITLNTVQVHVGRILRKLRVESRAAVARLVTLAESESIVLGAPVAGG